MLDEKGYLLMLKCVSCHSFVFQTFTGSTHSLASFLAKGLLELLMAIKLPNAVTILLHPTTHDRLDARSASGFYSEPNQGRSVFTTYFFMIKFKNNHTFQLGNCEQLISDSCSSLHFVETVLVINTVLFNNFSIKMLFV